MVFFENRPALKKGPQKPFFLVIALLRGFRDLVFLSFKSLVNQVFGIFYSDHYLSLRKTSLFKLWSLSDLFGVDNPRGEKRFRIVYRLRSFLSSKFLKLTKTASWERFPSFFLNRHTQDRCSVPSMVPVYKSRGWFERECWDLYGVYFSNNPDLRRILTDYGFRGFPQRKDFPLSGFIQSRYNHDIKKVSLEPTNFQFGQTYRYFEFKSPWEDN